MSSEVCPFCGKIYKRLKSHLPHCKAAVSSKTPPTKHDVTVNQTPSQLDAALSEPTAESKETLLSAGKQSKKGKKMSVETQSSLSLSSASLPPSTKKKTPKISLTSSLTPTTSKPKKQSLRALIEAAKSQQVSKGSIEETRSDSEHQTPFVADPLSSITTAETKTNPDKDSINDNAHPSLPSTDTKPKAASKTKSKTKKAAQSTTKDTFKVNKSSAHKRNDFWVENEAELEDLSVNNKMFLISGSGQQSRVTLQDVKATLGRGNASRPSILSQIETSLSPLPLQTENQDLVKTEQRNSKQASLVALQQLELTSPAAPLLSAQVSKATPPVSMTEGLKVTGLVTTSPSLTKFSSPLTTARVETMRAEDVLKSQLEVRRENTADKGTKGALTQRTLGQVRLKELPEWLVCKTPSRPREVVDVVQRGWQWYYRRYIDVRKGGVGGLSMMLAGYCVLSYIWSYPHIKRDRWRKYH